MTLYEKRGRRYVPVRESEEWYTLPAGHYLITIRPGHTSLRRIVEPDLVGFEAAALIAEDAMLDAIRRASESRPRGEKLSLRERRAFQAWKEIMGGAVFWLERESAQTIAEAGIRAVREAYRTADRQPITATGHPLGCRALGETQDGATAPEES